MNNIKSIHQEDISTAYLKLLAASNDITKISNGNRDQDGVDCTLTIDKIDKIEFNDIKISVQVKSSINIVLNDDGTYYYDLSVKNYNKFCGESQLPKVFAILQLPRDFKWVDYDSSNEQLLVRNKMFWYVIPKGSTKIESDGTTRIKLDSNNFWTPDNFRTVCNRLVQEFYNVEGDSND